MHRILGLACAGIVADGSTRCLVMDGSVLAMGKIEFQTPSGVECSDESTHLPHPGRYHCGLLRIL